MRTSTTIEPSALKPSRLLEAGLRMPRQLIIGIILVVALVAFELFNFDTTRYALEDLLGDVRFAGLAWATILAVAFCAIDFAGLARLFTPEHGREQPKEIWYLTGAWLLGATMNAVMTWWAVSLTLLNHELGNEVLSREQLLNIVPVFVAILVWLTRILFIGALTMAGAKLLAAPRPAARVAAPEKPAYSTSPVPTRTSSNSPDRAAQAGGELQTVDLASPQRNGVQGQDNSRVRQRPPRPASGYGKPGHYKPPTSSG